MRIKLHECACDRCAFLDVNFCALWCWKQNQIVSFFQKIAPHLHYRYMNDKTVYHESSFLSQLDKNRWQKAAYNQSFEYTCHTLSQFSFWWQLLRNSTWCYIGEQCHRLDFPTLQFPSASIVPYILSLCLHYSFVPILHCPPVLCPLLQTRYWKRWKMGQKTEVTVEVLVWELEVLGRQTWLQHTCIAPLQSQGVQFQPEKVNGQSCHWRWRTEDVEGYRSEGSEIGDLKAQKMGW